MGTGKEQDFDNPAFKPPASRPMKVVWTQAMPSMPSGPLLCLSFSEAMGLMTGILPYLLAFLGIALAWGAVRWGRRLEHRLGERRLSSAQERLQALELSQEEQARLCQARTELLEGMTHALRPPLNAIQLYTELIQDHAREHEDPDLLSDSANIQAAAHHLAALLGNLLDLSRLETGGIVLASELVPVEALCRDVEATLEPLASLRGNAVTLELPAHLVPIPSDRGRLQQILVNILAEASQGTESETLTLKVHQDATSTQFRLLGGRLGLTYHQLQQLLQRASGEDSLVATPSQFRHALGLALSARLARLLGGRLLQPADGGLLLLELPTTRNLKRSQEQAEIRA